MSSKKSLKSDQKVKEVKVADIPISEDTLEKAMRIGVSSNFMTLSNVSPEEVQLDFMKISVSGDKAYKDLVSRVTLSNHNAKELRDLLNRNIKD